MINVTKEQVVAVVKTVANNRWTHICTAGIVCGGIGFYAGRRFEAARLPHLGDFLEELEEFPLFEAIELEEFPLLKSIDWRDFIEELEDAPVSLTMAYDEFELEDDAEYILELNELEDAEPLKINVFEGRSDSWDMETELSGRDPMQPYVIHVEEWVSGESGFDQNTVVYYEGDDIMADENDTPIYGYSGMMGDLKFGHGSEDPSVVFVRNEQMGMEWEVLLHTGRFEIEVLGLEIESEYEKRDHLEHSNRRFRDE